MKKVIKRSFRKVLTALIAMVLVSGIVSAQEVYANEENVQRIQQNGNEITLLYGSIKFTNHSSTMNIHGRYSNGLWDAVQYDADGEVYSFSANKRSYSYTVPSGYSIIISSAEEGRVMNFTIPAEHVDLVTVEPYEDPVLYRATLTKDNEIGFMNLSNDKVRIQYADRGVHAYNHYTSRSRRYEAGRINSSRYILQPGDRATMSMLENSTAPVTLAIPYSSLNTKIFVTDGCIHEFVYEKTKAALAEISTGIAERQDGAGEITSAYFDLHNQYNQWLYEGEVEGSFVPFNGRTNLNSAEQEALDWLTETRGDTLDLTLQERRERAEQQEIARQATLARQAEARRKAEAARRARDEAASQLSIDDIEFDDTPICWDLDSNCTAWGVCVCAESAIGFGGENWRTHASSDLMTQLNEIGTSVIDSAWDVDPWMANEVIKVLTFGAVDIDGTVGGAISNAAVDLAEKIYMENFGDRGNINAVKAFFNILRG